MRALSSRLARLERLVADQAAPLYWCEETDSDVRFHGPGGVVILPLKGPVEVNPDALTKLSNNAT